MLQLMNIEIDKLTNSVENTISGDTFSTDISLINEIEIKKITKKSGWLFNWKKEFQFPDRDIYKLTITGNSEIIQGLISITEKYDHVYINLIESAPFNQGKNKLYLGVPGNLVAFACKISFHRGFQGFVAFTAKTDLIRHYIETLGAQNIGAQLMIINTNSALKLVNKYFGSKI